MRLILLPMCTTVRDCTYGRYTTNSETGNRGSIQGGRAPTNTPREAYIQGGV